MNRNDNGVPLEVFIQALTSQLDRAQDALRLKASAQRPLTFAVKDLSLELRSHVEMTGSVVRIRPAGPNETQTSTLHIELTTITRPMIEENTAQLAVAAGEPSIKDVLGSDVSDDDKENIQRRLEWAGIHTVSQLRDLRQNNNQDALQRVTQLPIQMLRMALANASAPHVSRVLAEAASLGTGPKLEGRPAGTPLLRVHGSNLALHGTPAVTIGGEAVTVVTATDRELLLAPLPHQLVGTLAIETGPGASVQAAIDLKPATPPGPPSGTPS